MFDTEQITTEHKDLIHDVAYDYYGQRFATCSSVSQNFTNENPALSIRTLSSF